MVLNLPLYECIDNTHTKVTREKRNEKETNKRKLQQAIESQTKAKSKITVSDPLGKGNGSTHPRQSKAQAKSANHRNKA
jgi:hypothetical protein